MKTVISILLVIVILFLLNPSVDMHKEKVNQKCKELNQISGAVGGCAVFSQLGLKYYDYKILSYTAANTGNKQVVSLGVLGMVFVIANLDI